MVGTIFLYGLEVNCIVGIYDKERKNAQQLFLDVEVDYDFSEAAHSEKIQDTLDYTVMADALDTLLKKEKFQLIETAAEKCCELIFSKWPNVQRCKLKIKKPGAVDNATYAAVEIERKSGE